jgi:serine/threonine protein kinase
MSEPTPDARVEELFDHAIDLPLSERARFIRDACGQDTALSDRLRRLLALAERDDGILDRSPLGAAGLPAPEASAVDADIPAGAPIGAYRIVGLIGRGGMGEVYRATRADGLFEKDVAAKVLRRDAVAHLDRFEAERRILARLDHPGIARLLDGGLTGEGRPYMLVELVDGVGITDYARAHRLSLDRRLDLFRQCCEAVAFAHDQGVIHRDLKPQNVLVTAEGRVKLLDFGVAKLLRSPGVTVTTTTVAPLTLAYASPEQLQGEAVSPATDVHSLGVVLFELLTGRTPWQGQSDSSVSGLVYRILNDAPPLASEMAREVLDPPLPAGLLAGDLDAILARCLRKSASERYVTVAELLADLIRYGAGQPALAEASTGLSPLATRALPEPRTYTPKHLAEKILKTRSDLEGERKQVTVLFCGLKDSIELSAGVDAEDWQSIAERFQRITLEAIHRFEGTVSQRMGDRVIALFGAPLAHEDHAQRACHAALSMREELAHYASELRDARRLDLSVRMGIGSGEVVVGKIGNDLRMDYTALGHTTNVAARMEQLAKPGTILLAETTAKLVQGFFLLREYGEHVVQGVVRAVRVFELLAPGEVHTSLQAAERRGFSRFVGRETEMGALESALARAIGGEGSVLGVVGEPGVGKSRLCREFVGRVRERSTAVYEGHCPAHGKTIPYIPILELFRSYFGIVERDSPVEARKKIATTLLALDESFRAELPLVCEFLAVPDPDDPAPIMDPQAKQKRLYGFLRALVRARSRKEPAVILVDDLHWVDDASDAFLAELIDAIDGTRTLCLVNFRPEYSAAWTRKSSYQQIALKPLGAREINELVASLVGPHPSAAGLGDLIRERTGGNPFFIEETIHELAETGKLEGHPGGYRLIPPLDTLNLPARVQVVLAGRIDRLEPRDKETLQAASVIGKNFPGRVLLEVAGLVEGDLAASLHVLREKEFLYEERTFPESEYAFKHPLTHEVAYQSQLGPRRRTAHETVARAIEKLYPEKLDERAALVAHHWESAGKALEAARWNARAAVWTGTNAAAEALRHWKKVRELLSAVPEDDETLKLGFDARGQILSFGWRMGLAEEESQAIFDEGRALAERIGGKRALAALYWAMGGVVGLTGNMDRYMELNAEGLRHADESGDLGVRYAIRTGCSWAHYHAGLPRAGHELIAEILREVPPDLRTGSEITGYAPYVFLRGFRGLFTGYASNLERGAELVREYIELAKFDRELLLLGHSWAGDFAELSGDDEGALRHGNQALELAERSAAEPFRSNARATLLRAHLLRGEWSDAARLAREALVIMHEQRSGLEGEARILAGLAEALLGSGEVKEAVETADKAVANAMRSGSSFWEIFGRLAAARALAATEAAAAAEAIRAHLERASQLIEHGGAKVLMPFVLLERANLERARGNDRAFRAELELAKALFIETGATRRAAAIAARLGS